jgi:outer membrane protein OmpA-like peptidoglycan-associated protein
VHVDYANDPLVLILERNGTTEVGAVVAHQVTAQATVYLGLFDTALAFVQLPINLMMTGHEGAQQAFGSEGDPLGAGNLSIGARARLLGETGSGYGLALQGSVQLPTSKLLNDDQRFSGTHGVGVWPQLVGDYEWSHVRLVGNLGALLSTHGLTHDDTEPDAELSYGLGVNVPITSDSVNACLELLGTSDLSTAERSPLELLLGAKFYPDDWMMGVAAGPGLHGGVGSPDLRVIGAVGYIGAHSEPAPVAASACAGQQEDMDGFQDDDGCPDPDNDNDGLLDARDACPLAQEDLDAYRDDDGCPDLDNDEDGIADAADRCPQQAEDIDTFEDDDGCPDPDNDKDGLLDERDQCRGEAEDIDAFQDADGCPDADNDADGVADALDACPSDAETVNGVDDADGCPDTVRVDRESKQLTTLEPVFFKSASAEILDRSFNMLREIAELIKAHPELGTISVEGHTDARGTKRRNLELSKARAESVRTFLIAHGAPAERVEAHGFGSDRPIKQGSDEAALEANRRVEFRLGGP